MEDMMKLTKFDRIQLVFNLLLIIATVLNVLRIVGVLPGWSTLVGFVLAVAGCIMTNMSTQRKDHSTRETVSGNPILAALTFVTGAAWIITYAVIMFYNIDLGVKG